MDTDELDFLEQSNFIEDVRDGLDDSIKAWKYISDYGRLTVKRILLTHRLLMRKYLEEEAGKLRTCKVWIGEREGKPWFALPELIDQWVKIANKSKTEFQIKGDHVLFEDIHPFVDGNGRMGRILLNWQRVKSGFPILVIREEDKWDYYKWFV